MLGCGVKKGMLKLHPEGQEFAGTRGGRHSRPQEAQEPKSGGGGVLVEGHSGCRDSAAVTQTIG